MQNRSPLAVSVAALVVAVLGSTPVGQAAYNAVVPDNSVGTTQLRNLSVTGPKIRGDAVDSGKVKNHSLKAIDFAPNQIPAGPKGDKGDKGASGATKLVIRSLDPYKSSGAGSIELRADCKRGEVAVGGGAGATGGKGDSQIKSTGPLPVEDGKTPTGWQTTINYNNFQANPTPLVFTVWVVCAMP
jgi:hypothetical protein